MGWRLAAALYTVVLLVGLLVPIHGLYAHPRAYLLEFHGLPPGKLAGDVLRNVAAFVPLGWLLARAGPGTVARAVAVTAVCALFSLGVETVQYFIVTRYSSILDVVANAAGAGIGALLAIVRPGRRTVRPARVSNGREP